jgi:hypothetical protein
MGLKAFNFSLPFSADNEALLDNLIQWHWAWVAL